MNVVSKNKLRIIIIHPDLGIGGAERLIVDIAKAMQALGHDIKLYTSHHDSTRCFEETRGDGVIADCIEVHGSWLPRQIFGRCTALCAIVRMVYVSLVAILGHHVGKCKPSLIFIDSVRTNSVLLLSSLPILMSGCLFSLLGFSAHPSVSSGWYSIYVLLPFSGQITLHRKRKHLQETGIVCLLTILKKVPPAVRMKLL